MDRRTFLKIVSAVPAVTAIPAYALEFVPQETKITSSQKFIGLMREIIAYDISKDAIVIRHDVYNGQVQIGIDQILPNRKVSSVKKARISAAHILLDEIQKRNIKLSSLKPLSYSTNIPILPILPD